jgi:hypothetical protein
MGLVSCNKLLGASFKRLTVLYTRSRYRGWLTTAMPSWPVEDEAKKFQKDFFLISVQETSQLQIIYMKFHF